MRRDRRASCRRAAHAQHNANFSCPRCRAAMHAAAISISRPRSTLMLLVAVERDAQSCPGASVGHAHGDALVDRRHEPLARVPRLPGAELRAVMAVSRSSVRGTRRCLERRGNPARCRTAADTALLERADIIFAFASARLPRVASRSAGALPAARPALPDCWRRKDAGVQRVVVELQASCRSRPNHRAETPLRAAAPRPRVAVGDTTASTVGIGVREAAFQPPQRACAADATMASARGCFSRSRRIWSVAWSAQLLPATLFTTCTCRRTAR